MDNAKQAGASAVKTMRKMLAEQAVSLLQRDPDLVKTAVEVGLVDRNWVDEPGRHPLGTSSPREVVQRFLERSVERKPSTLASMGLSALQLLSAGSEEVQDGEPSPVAIVFTDLEGFTRFTAKESDEAALELLAEHHRTVGPLVRSRGGRIVKRIGDGLMLSFPSAEAAVLAAVELVETPPPPLRLRAGVHCGQAVVAADDLIGHDVNVAARVAECAKGDQVLATGAIRDEVGDLSGVSFGRARRRKLKGVGESVALCPVQRVSRSTAR